MIKFIGWILILMPFKAAAEVTDGKADLIVKTELQALADRVNLLLGGKRADDSKNESTLRLKDIVHSAEHALPTQEFHINIVTKIATIQRWKKQLQNWAQLEEFKLKDDVEHEFADKHSKDSGAVASTYTEDAETTTPAEKRHPWQFSLDKKVSFRPPKKWNLDAYVRVRKDFETGSFLHSSSQQAGWSLANMWQAQGDLESNYQLSSATLLAVTHSYEWQITQKKFSTQHGPVWRFPIENSSIVSIGGGLGTDVVDNVWKVSSYSLGSSYRKIFNRNNLALQVSPYVVFAEIKNYRGSVGVILSLEAEI